MLLQKRQVRGFMRLTCRNHFCAFFKDHDTRHDADPPLFLNLRLPQHGGIVKNLANAFAVLFGLKQAQITQLTLEHLANRAAG